MITAMNHKFIFAIIILLATVSCKSKYEKIEENLQQYMDIEFPMAEYKLNITKDHHHLSIIDKTIVEEDVNDKISFALANLYESFYKASNEANTNSSFMVSINNMEFLWESDTYSLIEMSQMTELEE